MNESVSTGISVFICRQCIPQGAHLPRQWTQDGVLVRAKELPCSGKTDAQYLFHAIEGGARGVLVVTCPHGECKLSQGNYRADVRVGTVRKLLEEIGMEPDRVSLIHCGPDDNLEAMVREAVSQFCVLGESPICAGR